MQIFQCHLLSLGTNEECVKGSRDGVVVVALASHPRGAGSIKARDHGWVQLVVCSDRFFSGFSGFSLSSKINFSKF